MSLLTLFQNNLAAGSVVVPTIPQIEIGNPRHSRAKGPTFNRVVAAVRSNRAFRGRR